MTLPLMLGAPGRGRGNSSPSSTRPVSRSYNGSGVIFVSDFNQDNKPDLLTSDGTMNIGQGDGTFIAGTHVPLPTGFSVVAVADSNGDKKTDLLLASFLPLPFRLWQHDSCCSAGQWQRSLPNGSDGQPKPSGFTECCCG
jgi:hypothetical protein